MRRKLFSVNEVTRRKLFSDNKVQGTRRKLFSDDECNCNLPPKSSEDKVIKCMDCGQTYNYDGSDSHLICTRCGGDRFEFIENISNPDELEPGDLNPVDKAFSEKRRKLYSDDTSDQPSVGGGLVDKNAGGSLTHQSEFKDDKIMACPDCGQRFPSKDQYVDNAICPNCGGTRCRIEGNNVGGVSDEVDQSENPEENAFSDIESDELGKILKKYKGKKVNEDELSAELHANGIYDEVGGVKGLVDKGYATEEGDQVMFSEVADFQRRLFSKLVISVTKEFDIDPMCDRESAIDSLAEKFPGKPIMILKRAQSSVAPEVTSFSDKSYLKDSGIESDIKVEYGGQTMPIKDFMNLLNEEYPDAPDDIIDLLESSKAIKVNGGKVLISK